MKKHPIVAVSIPILFAVVVGCIIRSMDITTVAFERFEFLLNTIITTSATVSGFILASVTILVGATSSAIMNNIRDNGGLQELRWRYTEALILGLIVIIYFTFLGAIVDANNNSMTIEFLSLSAGLLVGYLSSVVLTCYYLLSIIGKLYYEAPVEDSVPSSPPGPFRFDSDK